MARVDSKGVRHPTSNDAWNPGEDYPHVKDCPECRATDWGRNLLWLVDHQDELPLDE